MSKNIISSYVRRYLSFEDDEIDFFYSLLEKRSFEKKEFLLQSGHICHYKYFITKGLTRSYKVGSNGKEEILQFAIDNWWLTHTESFVRKTPSQINIQALEQTEVLMISRTNLEILYQSKPKFERLFRILAENMIIALQRHSGTYMKLSSKQRYDLVAAQIPDLLQRVPQYMVAAYLDITPEYLSELRKSTFLKKS